MNDVVHVGRDGWLFLTGGTNGPIRMYRRSLAQAWLLQRWAWLIGARGREARRRGIRYLHLAAPEKLSVYADAAPDLRIDPTLGNGQVLSRMTGDESICPDVVPALIAARREAETFLRTDSHWSSEGCRIAHDAVCRALGAPLRWSLDERVWVHLDDFTGDLGNKLSPAPTETLRRSVVQQDAVRTQANTLVLACEAAGRIGELHRGACVVFRNEAADADPRRLVLFGDSYSDFTSHNLTGMLAETFREVHFIWSPQIDWGYVDRVRPDIVMSELAERFMFRLRSDRGFDNEVFARERMTELGLGVSG